MNEEEVWEWKEDGSFAKVKARKSYGSWNYVVQDWQDALVFPFGLTIALLFVVWEWMDGSN